MGQEDAKKRRSEGCAPRVRETYCDGLACPRFATTTMAATPAAAASDARIKAVLMPPDVAATAVAAMTETATVAPAATELTALAPMTSPCASTISTT
jgi:hypothetical protein